MNEKHFFLMSFLLLFLSLESLSQKDVELINSSECLLKASKFYKQGEYQNAIDTYSKISRNDSSYAVAVSEIAASLIYEKQYEKALEYSLKGLALKSAYDNNYYNTAGIALKNLERYEEAVNYFNEGLQKFPNDQYLYYNLAGVYEKLKKMDLAIKNYQNSIISNPYYSTAHYSLGRIYALNEKPVQAMMAFQMFLILEPATTSSLEVLQILESTVNNLFPPAEDKDRTQFPADEFEELQILIKSKIALNKNYKSKTKLNYVLSRQIQLFLEKLAYNSDSKDFFMQYYVPFFIAVNKQGQLEPLVYLVYASAENKEVQQIVKKNISKIKTFITLSYKIINDLRKLRPLVNENPDKKLTHFFYSNNHLQAVGVFKDALESAKSGEWQFYHSNGSVSSFGHYDENGKAIGEWRFFYADGTLKQVENYANGELDGIYYSCHPNGIKKTEMKMVNGKGDEYLKYFFPSGQLKQIFTLTDNKKDGVEVTYFESGKKKTEGMCVQGKRDGEYRVYYETGELNEIINIKNDERNGLYKEFQKNGSILAEGQYKLGHQVGIWKFYYENGKLLREGNFSDKGSPIGIWHELHIDGIALKKEYTYDEKGLLTGTLKEFALSGKIYYDYTYVSDVIKNYKYYNEEGLVISEGKESKGILSLTGKAMDGRVIFIGDYLKGQMSGEWKFYDPNGNLEYVKNYKSGKLDGMYVEFYSNGSIYSEVNFKNGDMEGLYKSYYRNKNLNNIGWYVNDQKQGDWYHYSPNEKLESHLYYNGDEMDGYNMYYKPNNFLDYEEYYKYQLLMNVILYDTTGKKYSEVSLPNGTGEYLSKFPDGNIKVKGKYVNGNAEGLFEWSYYNGKISSAGSYVNGKRQGSFVNYFYNDRKSSEKYYEDGMAAGNWKWYHPNGKIYKSGFHVDGKSDSTWNFYFDNGQISYVVDYKKDKKNGSGIYYNSQGGVVCKKIYNDGRVIAYSYLDKSGNFVPEIKVENETVQLVAFYPNGNKSLEENIEKGNYEGKRIFYFTNGEIESISNYKNNVQEGEEVVYFQNGKLKSKEIYFYGEQDGEAQYLREDGSLESEGNYYLGDKHGEWKFYSKTGKIENIITYWFGTPYGERK